MFKSYYVVWKQKRKIIETIKNFRLNRTMQYGNFCLDKARLKHIVEFKSYYVVWKLIAGVRILASYGFKSYYVVWKLFLLQSLLTTLLRLNRTMQYGNQQATRNIVSKFFCLNRTMQYGNWFTNRIYQHKRMFKSYYVVWKQYEKENDKKCECRFKSYYVVWKLLFFFFIFEVEKSV